MRGYWKEESGSGLIKNSAVVDPNTISFRGHTTGDETIARY